MDDNKGGVVLCFLCWVIGVIFGFLAGTSAGEWNVRSKAAEANAGYWHSDPKTGEQEFVWGKQTEKGAK